MKQFGIRLLKDVRLSDIATVGGKAANLGELISLGVTVPAGFVIMPNAKLEDSTSEILRQFDALKVPTAAVRSSATIEDGKITSFAGQFDTYLHVDRYDLIKKIQACRQSVQNERLQAYFKQHGLSSRSAQVAVIVQTMVEPLVAGVAFSKNPLTGSTDEFLIEAGYGLGEAVVSGRITPDEYVVDKTGRVISSSIAPQQVQLCYNGFSIVETPVPADLQSAQKLSANALDELVGMVRTIENHYGHAVDVEWAYNDRGLYILQARPITT